MSDTDMDLLGRYARHRSEDAFEELVSRHLNLVHSAALRQVRSPELAEEVAQSVFLKLARHAGRLAPDTPLAAWLYQVTRREAVDVVRREARRRVREQLATEMNDPLPDSTPWARIEPLLDEGMAALGEADRRAVLVRYFENRSLREVGRVLGTSEDGAQKRVARAVARLRRFLLQRGVAVGTGALTAMISSSSVQAAPAGLLKAISVAAVAQGVSGGSSVFAVLKGFLKSAAAPLVGLFGAFAASMFYTLRAEIESARSPRERRLVVRMIQLRFLCAAVLVLVLAGVRYLAPGLLQTPGFVEVGVSALMLVGAIEFCARFVYFHRRRRQIQMEDGTLAEPAPVAPAGPRELLGDLQGRSSQANRHAAAAALASLVGCLIATPYMVSRLWSGGHTVAALLFLALGIRGGIRCLRSWRRIPTLSFDSRLRIPMGVLAGCGMGSLALLDLSWGRGRLPFSPVWILALNLALVLVYAALMTMLLRTSRASR